MSNALHQLRDCLLRESVLKHHNPFWPTPIETDSSGYAVAAVLILIADAAMDKTQGSTIFCILDLWSAYQQVRIHPPEIPKTTLLPHLVILNALLLHLVSRTLPRHSRL